MKSTYLIKKYLDEGGFIVVESWSRTYDEYLDLTMMDMLTQRRFAWNWLSNLEVQKQLRMLIVNKTWAQVEYIGSIL